MINEEDFYTEVDLQYAIEKQRRDLKHKIWTTKTGERIRVANMSNSYLKGTLGQLKSMNKTAEFDPNKWIELFEDELNRRNK